MRLIAIALLLLPLAALAQMRCPDGSYQSSCPGGQSIGGSGVSSYQAPDAPPIQHNRAAGRRYQQAGASAQQGQPVQAPQSTRDRARAAGISRNDLVKARSRGTLLPGMARQDVDHIMGRPNDVVTSVSAGRRCDDLWYRDARRGWHTRVTMCDGQLQSYGAADRR
ncbi:hypothetical protein [Halomonas sp. LBP4]|uniref:hypothetical protein n=1 Tax=Halomonas sp. LBP4 TaxID=2044917 RepID=UPI000D752831|nr:hypothetical protein [Halomonas sp. LBP4]PXX97356.1 hypothetical protein CR157_11525 [Halomonas sp. LBP4]